MKVYLFICNETTRYDLFNTGLDTAIIMGLKGDRLRPLSWIYEWPCQNLLEDSSLTTQGRNENHMIITD